MRSGTRALLVAAVCAIALVAVGQAAAAKSHLRLNYYSATTTQAKYQKTLKKGADIVAVKTLKSGKVLRWESYWDRANGLEAAGLSE